MNAPDTWLAGATKAVSKRPHTQALYVGLGILLGIFCVLTILSATGITTRAETAVSHRIPTWVVTGNLFLAPVLLLAATKRTMTGQSSRLLLVALLLISIALLEICFRRNLWGSAVALFVLLVEAYWVVPRRQFSR